MPNNDEIISLHSLSSFDHTINSGANDLGIKIPNTHGLQEITSPILKREKDSAKQESSRSKSGGTINIGILPHVTKQQRIDNLQTSNPAYL